MQTRPTRKCCNCFQVKDLELDFYRKGLGTDGLPRYHHRCKGCGAEATRTYRRKGKIAQPTNEFELPRRASLSRVVVEPAKGEPAYAET